MAKSFLEQMASSLASGIRNINLPMAAFGLFLILLGILTGGLAMIPPLIIGAAMIAWPPLMKSFQGSDANRIGENGELKRSEKMKKPWKWASFTALAFVVGLVVGFALFVGISLLTGGAGLAIPVAAIAASAAFGGIGAGTLVLFARGAHIKLVERQERAEVKSSVKKQEEVYVPSDGSFSLLNSSSSSLNNDKEDSSCENKSKDHLSDQPETGQSSGDFRP